MTLCVRSFQHEGVTVAYVCRLLPPTLLAPDIVEAILDGRHPKGLRLAELLGNGPMAWRSSGRGRGSKAAPKRLIRFHPGWTRTHDC